MNLSYFFTISRNDFFNTSYEELLETGLGSFLDRSFVPAEDHGAYPSVICPSTFSGNGSREGTFWFCHGLVVDQGLSIGLEVPKGNCHLVPLLGWF